MKSIVVIFLENSQFLPVFFALKMAEELKPVAFNVEPYQFELTATESDCEISDDIRPTAVASKVNDRIGKVYWLSLLLGDSRYIGKKPVKNCLNARAKMTSDKFHDERLLARKTNENKMKNG